MNIMPKARIGEAVTDVPPLFIMVDEIEVMKEKTRIPYRATMTGGTIIEIKLAVKPSFLPDSRDMLMRFRVYLWRFRDKLCVDKESLTAADAVWFSKLSLTRLVAYQVTDTEKTARANTTPSNKIRCPAAKGTRKSTNPMGNAIRNSCFLLKTTAITQR
jgi:hypothetical protein